MAAFGLSSEKAYRPVRVLLPTWMIEHARCNVARTKSPVGRWTGVYQRAILRPRRYIFQCYTLSSMFFSTWAFLIPYGEEKTSPPPFIRFNTLSDRTNERTNKRTGAASVYYGVISFCFFFCVYVTGIIHNHFYLLLMNLRYAILWATVLTVRHE